MIATIYDYYNGLYKADQQQLAKAFDMQTGNMKTIKKGKVESTKLSTFATYFTKPSNENWLGNILMVDIVEDRMAMVKFNFETPEVHYIDYLILLKTDQGWKITSKAYVANPPM
ncbi:nuclear transport factor 2 family protein [Shewanella gaetbuli]